MGRLTKNRKLALEKIELKNNINFQKLPNW